MTSSPSTSTQLAMEEARVLYFTRRPGNIWIFRDLPISRTHLDSAPASLPSPIHRMNDSGSWDRLCELVDKLGTLLATNGAFEGWKIHFLENPVVITGYYQAKVIITRTVSPIQPEPSASLPSTNYSYS